MDNDGILPHLLSACQHVKNTMIFFDKNKEKSFCYQFFIENFIYQTPL